MMSQIASKALRPLAALGAKRAVQLPQVPTVREQGGSLEAFDVSSWNGLAVPARTPKDVVARLNRAVQTALAQPDVKKRLLDLNLVAQGSTEAQLAALLDFEIKRWGDVIQKAGVARQ